MNKLFRFGLIFLCTFFLYIGFSQTSTYAAAVGEQLKSPEEGWTRYLADNKLFNYGTIWEHRTDEKAKIPYAGSKTGGTGDLTFNFEGTGLRLLTSVNYSYSKKVAISIDGNVEYFIPHNQSVRDYNYNVLMYEKKDLQMGVHEVKIWTVEPSKNTLRYDYRLYSIDVIGELTNKEPIEVPPVTEEPPPATIEPEKPSNPEPQPEPSGDRAILVVTMTTGLEKEFDLSMQEVNSFIDWYEAKQAGSGRASYAIDKHDKNKGSFKSRKDYILFDRVLTFEVSEY
ncbi:hypothetical protein MH215_09595 [Paenibacillus sp. ACRSA]|uniref:hypothetical protein n=1 Tax=Paenibacillus sp. ACRSA TaxID=2918211 RepID=UPI001EF55C1C|nr:hypothetical protein [Paenibacillus sp. ACRSA]MCG7377247.1 hypothetical protein [Paenibacillus sp. ACRSA]